MRHLISKLMTGSLVAGAALLVSACGHSESTNVTENTTMTDLNTMSPDGTSNDMMATDANMAGNSAMMDANAADNSSDMTSNNGM